MPTEGDPIRHIGALSYHEQSVAMALNRLDNMGEERTAENIYRVAAEMGDDFNPDTTRQTAKKLADEGYLIREGRTDSGDQLYRTAPGTLRAFSDYARTVGYDIGMEARPDDGVWAFPAVDSTLAAEQWSGPGELTLLAFGRDLTTNQCRLLHAIRSVEVSSGVAPVTNIQVKVELENHSTLMSDKGGRDARDTLAEYGLIEVDRIGGEYSPCVFETTEAGKLVMTMAAQCMLEGLGDRINTRELHEVQSRSDPREVTTDVGLTESGGDNNEDMDLSESETVQADD